MDSPVDKLLYRKRDCGCIGETPDEGVGERRINIYKSPLAK
jgi:hypothetical protein